MKHVLVANWRIHSEHWCDQHQRTEYGDAWATQGLVSLFVPI